MVRARRKLLDMLSFRDWIAQEGKSYVAREEGNHLPEEAGDATDRFFDAA